MSAAHQTIGIDRVRRDLNELHEQVIRNWGRIIITRGGESQGDAACVLISKAELDQLERALEIYNESSGGRAMCDELQEIADQDMPRSTTATLNFGEEQPAGQPAGQRKRISDRSFLIDPTKALTTLHEVMMVFG